MPIFESYQTNMTTETFTSLVVNPSAIGTKSLTDLDIVARQFPYCQLIHSLIAKGDIEVNNLDRVQQKISKAAAFALSRNALKLLFTDQIFSITTQNQNYSSNKTDKVFKESVVNEVKTKESVGFKVSTILSKSPVLVEKVVSVEPKKLDKGKRLNLGSLENFDSLRTTDLSQMLIEQETTILNQSASDTYQINQRELINKFIVAQPRIRPINRLSKYQDEGFIDSHNLVDRSSPQQPLDISTESFAKIMAKSGNFKSAVETYERLILKNPEKRTYFATKITEIKSRATNS